MSFSILYPEGGDTAFHIYSIASYLDSFAEHLGLQSLDINPAALNQVASGLARPSFPHVDGVEKASPFKKAANFFVWFVASRPIVGPLPGHLTGPKLGSIDNHQNVIFAYHMAVDCLHGASLRKNGEVIVLTRRIKVSKHFFRDFVEAFSAATPVHHFQVVSLLFEQLAYKVNRKASYPEIV